MEASLTLSVLARQVRRYGTSRVNCVVRKSRYNWNSEILSLQTQSQYTGSIQTEPLSVGRDRGGNTGRGSEAEGEVVPVVSCDDYSSDGSPCSQIAHCCIPDTAVVMSWIICSCGRPSSTWRMRDGIILSSCLPSAERSCADTASSNR